MNPASILEIYDAEVRAKPVARAGFKVEDEGGVVRLRGPVEFVSWWRLTENELERAVARETTWLLPTDQRSEEVASRSS